VGALRDHPLLRPFSPDSLVPKADFSRTSCAAQLLRSIALSAARHKRETPMSQIEEMMAADEEIEMNFSVRFSPHSLSNISGHPLSSAQSAFPRAT
jgi:hypothetical protein